MFQVVAKTKEEARGNRKNTDDFFDRSSQPFVFEYKVFSSFLFSLS